MIVRIKVYAGLEDTERGKAQFGTFKLYDVHDSLALRVACVPTVIGENVIVRIEQRDSGSTEAAQLN